MLGKLMNTYHVYTACMSPTLNGSSTLERFYARKIRNGIMFDFYQGLPHIIIYIYVYSSSLFKKIL